MFIICRLDIQYTVCSYGMGLLLIPAGGRLGILSVGRVGRTVVLVETRSDRTGRYIINRRSNHISVV